MATIVFGTIGVLASRTLSRLAGYCIVISSGTLLATIGAGEGAVLGGALFYLVSSTLGISAFYLLIELVERRDTDPNRSEEHTSELQSLMRISYAVFCLKKKNKNIHRQTT